MNNARRKEISIASRLIEIAVDLIETAANEEREYADAMPENLQESERFYNAEEAADMLDNAKDDLEAAIGGLEDHTIGNIKNTDLMEAVR